MGAVRTALAIAAVLGLVSAALAAVAEVQVRRQRREMAKFWEDRGLARDERARRAGL